MNIWSNGEGHEPTMQELIDKYKADLKAGTLPKDGDGLPIRNGWIETLIKLEEQKQRRS